MDTDDISVFSSGRELPSALRGMTATRLLGIIDQAEGGYTEELFALYRDIIAADTHIQSEFAKRKDAVLGDTVAVLPYDKTNPASVAAKELCEQIVDAEPFATLCDWLLNATLYPVAVAEKVFAPAPGGYRLARVVPVPFRLLDYSGGTIKIFDTDGQGNRLSTSRAPDPSRYIVHRGHNLPLPDTWGGPMRACLFWWLLKTMNRQWWAELLERFGMPFMKGKFTDEKGKAILTRAFSMAQRLGGVVISKNTEVELQQAASGDSANSHERFIEACNREISRLIVGQTLSSTAEATGLGSGTASLQGAVKDDIRKKDARLLAVTIRAQLFSQLCAINGESGPAPLVTFGSDSAAEIAALVGLVKGLGDAGLEPDDDALDTISERVGFHVRRKAAAQPFQPSPFSLHVLSAPHSPDAPKPEDHVGDLAAAFAGRYAPLRRIVAESTSSADCLRRCKAWLAEHDNSASAEILSSAMEAYAMRG
jgi:phage gp29-like protein